jgi:hypothetical protein
MFTKKAKTKAEDAKALEEARLDGPQSARPAPPLREGEKFDHLAEKSEEAEDRQEALLDEAIEETFPGSDPIAPKRIT